ncbi:MAG: hypothetical protein KDA93_05780 [Planctomycetaceae bacterium]|nr:hypothetical protein [Planctomycetaceae bacterium]
MNVTLAGDEPSGNTIDTVRSEYASRRDRYALVAERYGRGATFVSRAKRVVTYSIIGYTVFDPTVGFILVPLGLGLIPVTLMQSWCIRRWRRAAVRGEYYIAGLRRLDDQWQGHGVRGGRYADASHAYACDLDLFGRGSLFELLCTAKSRSGQDRLAAWLLSPADRQTILKRQQAIRELRECSEFREAIATVPSERRHRASVSIPVLVDADWVFDSARGKVLSSLWIVFLVAALVGAVVFGGGWWIAVAVAVVGEVALYHTVRLRLQALGQSIHGLKRTLSASVSMIRTMRRIHDSTPMLSELQRQASGDSESIRVVRRLLNALVLNEPTVLLMLLQLFPPLQRLHRRQVERLRDTLDAVGRVEALCSLATYAYEHPHDVFPNVEEEGPIFRTEGIGHPLLSESRCVRNDVTFEPPVRLLIISGSNMSGKTTLMRSVGVNVVLALAGAPVRARSMTLSPFVLGTAIRFADSLQEGASHFATVVQRMKQVIDMQQDDRPLLYLFDEILQGTNSQDRRVGAEAVLRRLVEANAFGIVSTHDLSLTEIVNDLDGRAINLHFEDKVIDGQMTFDYQLRPGVVQKSNALDVMRSFGLDV